VGARAASFAELLVLSYSGLMEVLRQPQFAEYRAPEDDFRRFNIDKGVVKTRDAYLELMKKYRKLQTTMKRVKDKMDTISKAADVAHSC
jgi:hypothetical protein